jgi:hypothetical protein
MGVPVSLEFVRAFVDLEVSAENGPSASADPREPVIIIRA